MKKFIQYSLFALTVFGTLLSTGAQAADFNTLMRLGVIESDSAIREVVIFNHDSTECLSITEQKWNSSKSLAYGKCRIDETDTWLITNVGKIKNKQSGKCLSAPKGEDRLVLRHCNYMYSKDNTAHDFIILDHMVDDNQNGLEIAKTGQ